MVDDEARIGVAVDQRRARIHVAPAQYVDWKVVLYGRAQDPVEARVIRLALRLLRHHDADADRARCVLPVGDDIAHGWIVWVDRLDDREPTGMGPLHLHRIARVVAVHGKGGDEDRAVDADLVHRRHHLVTRNVIGPVRYIVPGSLRSVRLISVDLGIDDRHRGGSSIAKRARYRNRSRQPCPGGRISRTRHPPLSSSGYSPCLNVTASARSPRGAAAMAPKQPVSTMPRGVKRRSRAAP